MSLCSAISDRRRRLLAGLFALTLLLSGCGRLFFLPESGHRWDPADADIVYEDVWFEAADGVRLHAWFLPVDEQPARGSVLFLHGNAENVSTHIASVYWLPERGYNVLMLDYRGFGLSGGSPDFAGVHRDAEAALAVLAEHEATDPERIIVFGQSLGAAVAITLVGQAGERYGVRGLVADSPFTSYRGIAREKFGEFWLTWPFQWPLSLTVSDRFAPRDFIGEVSPVPLLLLAGEADTIVPMHHAEALYEKAREPKTLWRLRHAGHIQSMAFEEVRRELVAWMDEVIGNEARAER